MYWFGLRIKKKQDFKVGTLLCFKLMGLSICFEVFTARLILFQSPSKMVLSRLAVPSL